MEGRALGRLPEHHSTAIEVRLRNRGEFAQPAGARVQPGTHESAAGVENRPGI